MFTVRCKADINGLKYMEDIPVGFINNAFRAVTIAKAVFGIIYDLRAREVKVVRVRENR
jgi:hypothetical protein